MAVVAITRIQHGSGDGKVTTFGIGDEVTGLNDDEVRSLVVGGSAVETGKKRKFSAAPTPGEQDEETLKRDALIAKAASDIDDDGAVTDQSDSASKVASAAKGAPASPGGPGAQNPSPAPR